MKKVMHLLKSLCHHQHKQLMMFKFIRYRIVVLAEDETEAFNFVIFDRAAQNSFGKTATKIIAESIKDEPNKEFPEEIEEITGKEVTLKVELNDDNILVNNTVYEATDAYECCIPTSSKSESTMAGLSHSKYGDNNVVELSNYGNTPGSAKSTTKKIKRVTL